MTAIAAKIATTKRAGELGIHSTDTFTMRVPDLKVADDVYGTFGPNAREDGDRLRLYTFGVDHHWPSQAKGPRMQRDHLSLAVFEKDFESGKGAMLMADNGYPRDWGMGHHALDSDYSHHVHNPWISYSEYSVDITSCTPATGRPEIIRAMIPSKFGSRKRPLISSTTTNPTRSESRPVLHGKRRSPCLHHWFSVLAMSR